MRSDSGWTDNELCEIWFRESFIPHVVARRVDDRKPVVLTFDGHESHETPAIKRLAYDNNIVLFCLPSKTTHKLQPLDVGVFSVLQRTWHKHSGDLAAQRTTIDRYNFIPEYLAARKKAITPELIIKAFRKTGIFPFNPNAIEERDYGPSMASSSELHLPPSYPDHTPSSPPAIPTDDEDGNSDGDFIPGHSSDAETDSTGSSDKDSPNGEEHEVEDNSIIDSYDKTPLLDSDTNVRQATPTDAQHTITGEPPEHSGRTASMPPELLSFSLRDHHPPALSTRSHSSVATSIYMTLSNSPDWGKSNEQLIIEKNAVYRQLLRKQAELDASEAHCSIMAQALADANKMITNMKNKKPRGTAKIKARWVALPELQNVFEAEEANRKEQERCNAEKEAQKQAEHLARQSQIMKDTVLKIFDHPLSTYKRKDELIVLAGALELDTTGTILALKERIKAYVDSHKNSLMQNPRFMGLFQARRQHAFDRENWDGNLSGEAGPSRLM